MKSSATWWSEVKSSPELMNKWLKDQYHGEITASHRIREFASTAKSLNPNVNIILEVIADQESQHASWVKDLLTSRGIMAEVLVKEERYWDRTLPKNYASKSTEELAAIGAHAEAMRLERIRVIAADESAPTDIRRVFQKILPQEEFHEHAFREIAGELQMSKALDAHKEGLEALGLTH